MVSSCCRFDWFDTATVRSSECVRIQIVCQHFVYPTAYQILNLIARTEITTFHCRMHSWWLSKQLRNVSSICNTFRFSLFFSCRVRAISHQQFTQANTAHSSIRFNMFTDAHKSPVFLHADTINYIITFYDYIFTLRFTLLVIFVCRSTKLNLFLIFSVAIN